MAPPDFPRQVVETVAKRAANYCSNPDCGTLTCGPADMEDRSITIGEAAHIFGARAGGARYDSAMSDGQRGDITNAIWLCRNCHKRIDDDPERFPAEILFEWRRLHEEEITRRLGKPSDAIRQKFTARQLIEFESCSYLAQQIVIDKPDYWEYKLTVELLRTRMGPVLVRWNALKRGLYVKQHTVVTIEVIADWLRARFGEIQKLIAAFTGLVNEELPASWGPSGQPGMPREILRVCDLLVDCADQMLRWEETIRFAEVPTEFETACNLLAGGAGLILDQLGRIPKELGAVLAQENPAGLHRISLTANLPDDWNEKFHEALSSAIQSLRDR